MVVKKNVTEATGVDVRGCCKGLKSAEILHSVRNEELLSFKINHPVTLQNNDGC